MKADREMGWQGQSSAAMARFIDRLEADSILYWAHIKAISHQAEDFAHQGDTLAIKAMDGLREYFSVMSDTERAEFCVGKSAMDIVEDVAYRENWVRGIHVELADWT